MSRYFSGRIGQAVLVLWAAFTVSFILLQVLPGDAILIKFQNPDMGLSPAQIADMRAVYGADVPVWDLLSSNFPPTLRLAVLGFVLATAVAIVIAFLSSLLHFGWLKSALQS